MKFDELIQSIKTQNKRAISKGISIVENENSESVEFLNTIYPLTGNAYKIGITGPPGAGKSTLTNELTKLILKQNKSVGIIAVDPTSPFTGGAVLGDRIRMNDIGSMQNVFIRSMATRGSLGGLSKKTIDAADVLDAANFDYIIFETVGVGQSELAIAKTADTTVVVLVPESGDSVQAMKAGLMEISDLFIVNKGDRPGSDNAINSLQTVLSLKEHDELSYLPTILKCTASEGIGIQEVLDGIFNHREYLSKTNKFNLNREKNLGLRVKELAEKYIQINLWNENRNEILFEEIKKKTQSPYSIAEKIIEHYKKAILINK